MRQCPNCNTQTIVTDTRDTIHNYVRRQRVCRTCDYAVTTYEIPMKDYQAFVNLLMKAREIMLSIMDLNHLKDFTATYLATLNHYYQQKQDKQESQE